MHQVSQFLGLSTKLALSPLGCKFTGFPHTAGLPMAGSWYPTQIPSGPLVKGLLPLPASASRNLRRLPGPLCPLARQAAKYLRNAAPGALSQWLKLVDDYPSSFLQPSGR